MIVDGHTHVILPVEKHLALMDTAGVDVSVVCMTRVHPEKAQDLAAFDHELQTLNAIIAGQKNNGLASIQSAVEEQIQVVHEHPTRFIGFGTVPLNLSQKEMVAWIEKYVIAPQFRGLGEFTLVPGTISLLEPVFALAREYGKLPLWVHTFDPLQLTDIQELITLSQRYQDVPLILGHLGGLHWRETISLVKEVPQAYLDLSATYVKVSVALAIQALPERTLFSSDAPWGDALVSRTMIEQATPSAEVRERVLGGNMLALLQRTA
jgi:Predicted metal-dependent hydrolase of the TIM-barrel fold